jgi:hypothetical protein
VWYKPVNYVSNATLQSGEKEKEMATIIASINREFTGHSITENVKILIGEVSRFLETRPTDHQKKYC